VVGERCRRQGLLGHRRRTGHRDIGDGHEVGPRPPRDGTPRCPGRLERHRVGGCRRGVLVRGRRGVPALLGEQRPADSCIYAKEGAALGDPLRTTIGRHASREPGCPS